MLVIDIGLRTGGACVAVMDAAAMGTAIVSIIEFLDWGWRVWGALSRITANAAVEGHAPALVITATIAVAVALESVSPAANVAATTASAGLSLLALVMLLAKMATVCSTTLAGLLWVLNHACRGLVANCIAEHLDLPLHGIDGGVVVA
jgi:hypothetical protein